MINFPSAPANGQQFTSGDRTWVWVAATSTWDMVPVGTADVNAAGASAIAAQAAQAKAQQWATKTDGEVEAGQGRGAKYYSEQAAATLANKAENADLADTTLAAKGSGRIGFNALLAYAAGTLGAYVKTLVTFTGLAADSGAGLVGKSGDTLSNIADWAPRARGLRATMDAIEPLNRLPQQCLLKRLRNDYTEFAVYSPMTADGIHWTRWYFTNRFNVGNAGCARLFRASHAILCPSTVVASYAENMTTGTEGQAPVSTQATADATARVGTWTASATVGGVADIRYSTVTGDKVTYTVTGATRIAWRAYRNTANGGVVKVTVKDAGVEIPSGQYLVPLNGADRTVDLRLQVGQFYIPVAEGLNPATTYTVEVEVHSSNPALGRAYDGGLRAYAATAYNSVGRHGTSATVVVGSTSTEQSYDAGCRVIYPITGATRIDWQYINGSNVGIAKFRVFNNVGVEISTYENATFDTYLVSSQVPRAVTVARGLAAGNYYLEVTASSTKNALSTDYRLLDEGAISYNEGLPGVLGVDAFDDQGILGSVAVEGSSTLIGTGNLELAIKVRKTTDAAILADFVGGTHGRETNPTTFVVLADGVVADYAGLAVNGTLIANTFSWSYDTTLTFPTGTQFATAHYTGAVSPGGYACSASRTATAAAIVHEDYAFMFNVPNTAAGTDGILGGFSNAAIEGDGNHTPTAFNDAVTQLPRQCAGMVVWNHGYAAYGFPVNTATVNQATKGAVFNPILGPSGVDSRSLLQDRTDARFKLYNRAFTGDNANGVTVAPGYTYTSKAVYRAFKASGLDVVLA